MRLTLVVKNTSALAVKNVLTLVLLGLLVMFLGCGKAEEKPASSKDQATQTADQPGGAPNAPATAPVAPPVSAGPAIATADGDMPGIRVEVQELKRNSGGTVTLKFAMINDSDKGFGLAYNFTDGDYSNAANSSVGGTHLIDPVGKKKYFVVRDTENTCLCSRGVPDIAPKSRANLWAKFPAPPDDVQKISIVIPHFGPIDDVAISR
ncbi:MAG: hypothetical protein ACT4OT_08125 [Acidobacteriota bacterium]